MKKKYIAQNVGVQLFTISIEKVGTLLYSQKFIFEDIYIKLLIYATLHKMIGCK